MLESFLVNLDLGPGLAAVRVALGALLVAVLHALQPEAGVWSAGVALAASLFLLKVVSAVARRFVPATPAVRAVWEYRRALARGHDSFQWRKLLWVGAGILAASLASPRGGWEPVLGGTCLVSGAAAEAMWRRKRLQAVPPEWSSRSEGAR